MNLKEKLRHVMNFPKEGIDFIDITTVLQDKEALKYCIDKIYEKAKKMGDYDVVAGPESRGFIFGVPIAYMSSTGFIPVRKKGKLPYNTVKAEYALEYGTNTLEMHADAIKKGQKVLIVDDLLATGGTTKANIELVEKLGGRIAGIVYFIELEFLKGREALKGYNIESIVKF